MNKTRQFFTMKDGNAIAIIEGEQGYNKVSHVSHVTPAQVVQRMNEFNHNSAEDVEVAVTCSMFGWDIPAADHFKQAAS